MAIAISSLSDIIEKINRDLGDFCMTFAYTRKELAGLARAPRRDIFFKYTDSDRDWAINEGSGTEIQYQIYMPDDRLYYGLGFNAQYVPFANDRSPVEWIKPYADAFLGLLDRHRLEWQAKGLDFVEPDGEEKLRNLTYGSYTLFGKSIELGDSDGVAATIDDEAYEQMLEEIRGVLFDIYKEVFNLRNNSMNRQEAQMRLTQLIDDNVSALMSAKNMIFYGAPGTGKTFLARQVAQRVIGVDSDDALKRSEQFGFVQFHPSYDYTDFVEGLRPTRADGAAGVGFELKNGVFKEFCEKARQNIENSGKTVETLSAEQQIEEKYDRLIEAIQNDELDRIELKSRGQYATIAGVTVNNNIQFLRPSDGKISDNTVSLPRLKKLANVYRTHDQLKALDNITQSIRDVIGGCDATRYWAVMRHLYKNYGDIAEHATANRIERKNYVFVIDEINRGEISKIFGELFFSIDPDYRGEKGAVSTQYANMHETDEKFYVPENVYILATMNDIDRSVESFDFAMRRRFIWREITAAESARAMNLPRECVGRMTALNDAISAIDGLSAAYHIGGAYFIDNGGNPIADFDEAWSRRLEPLLREYLRGMPDADVSLNELREAYESAAADHR